MHATLQLPGLFYYIYSCAKIKIRGEMYGKSADM